MIENACKEFENGKHDVPSKEKYLQNGKEWFGANWLDWHIAEQLKNSLTPGIKETICRFQDGEIVVTSVFRDGPTPGEFIAKLRSRLADLQLENRELINSVNKLSGSKGK